MNDLYLRTDTEAQMTWALIEAGVTDAEGNVIVQGAVDHIGPIEGVDERWHTNVRLPPDFPVDLLPVLDPPPAHPVRVFF